MSEDIVCSSPVHSSPKSSKQLNGGPIIYAKRNGLDSVSNRSSDVGIQATPAAMAADLNLQTPGILPITSAMIQGVNGTRPNDADLSSGSSTPTITGKMEKTPMCLINELARFNKVSHKYVLVDEKGPAHKKEFQVKLDIGTETFKSTGTSIKRAQHAAAEVALANTTLQRPPPKSAKCESTPLETIEKKRTPSTPTVELNSLVMKLGLTTKYENLEPPRMPFYSPMMMGSPAMHDPFHQLNPYQAFFPSHVYRGHRYMKQSFAVRLTIDKHVFKGEGPTRQQARHNAATKALRVVSNLPNNRPTSSSPQPSTSQQGDGNHITESKDPEVSEADESLLAYSNNKPFSSTASNTQTKEELSPDSVSEELSYTCMTKSEISLVHEIALQSGRDVKFDVLTVSGPPHMRNFITRCMCGDDVTEGQGNSKKSSKRKAAELMLEKLKCNNVTKLTLRPKTTKTINNKKKNRNLIKLQKGNIEYGSGINPISRLIQIQQANKRKEPVYSLLMEHGGPRKREFTIQVECNDLKCQGKGPNKKLAKRNAAEEMLLAMGYSKPSPTPGKSVLKSPDSNNHNSSHHSKHVTFSDFTPNKIPGILVRQESPSKTQHTPLFKTDLAASLANELLKTGKSVVGETLLPAKEHPREALSHPTDKLMYLGSCMGFAVDFTDFPKGTNNNQRLTLVTLRTNPAQVFHGCAATVEESHDKASLLALTKLAQSAPDEESGSEELTPPVKNKSRTEQTSDQTDDKEPLNTSNTKTMLVTETKNSEPQSADTH